MTFTAEDDCNLTPTRSVILTIVDSTAPPANPLDDEMTFIIIVIDQNINTSSNATINGTPVSGDYYKIDEFGLISSKDSVLSFSIIHDVDSICSSFVTINDADF